MIIHFDNFYVLYFILISGGFIMNLALPEMVVLNGTVFELDKFKKEYHAVNYIMPYSEFERIKMQVM